MNRNHVIKPAAGLLLLCLAAGTAWADKTPKATAPLRALELAIETSGAQFNLPAGGVGNITLVPCNGCRAQTLLLGLQARLLLDGRAVNAMALQRSLRAQPRSSVAVFYRRGSTEITRVVAYTPR